MRDKIVVGNWKMNLNYEEAILLGANINAWIADNQPTAEVIIAPSFIYLQTLLEAVDEQYLKIASQDISAHEAGAYTGDLSAHQLDSIGLDFAIVGHSERREYQGETDAIITEKLKQAFKHQIHPILCVGEKLEERENGNHFSVVKSQIINVLSNQKIDDLSQLIIAYEPVWAIGTGKTATSQQAQEIHSFIRNVLNDEFGVGIANNTSILYGGSLNVNNAGEIFSQPDIDGGLIGGASLKYDDFVQIISLCK